MNKNAKPIDARDAKILHYLWSQRKAKEGRGTSLDEIRERCAAELSVVAVRNTCTALKNSGRLRNLSVPQGRGRPKSAYVLGKKLPVSRTVAEVVLMLVAREEGHTARESELLSEIPKIAIVYGVTLSPSEAKDRLNTCVELGYFHLQKADPDPLLTADEQRIHSDRMYLDLIRLGSNPGLAVVYVNPNAPPTGGGEGPSGEFTLTDQGTKLADGPAPNPADGDDTKSNANDSSPAGAEGTRKSVTSHGEAIRGAAAKA